jgi:hypothetical protein
MKFIHDMVCSRGTWVLAALLAGILLASCADPVEPPVIEYLVDIRAPEDNATVLEGSLVQLEVRLSVQDEQGNAQEALEATGLNIQAVLEETVVVWYSDVVGVLSRSIGECSIWSDEEGAPTDDGEAAFDSTTCWLVEPASVGGELVWSLVTRLPAGTHVIHARALDTVAGRIQPTSSSVVVTVDPVSAPEVHLVSPEDGATLETGNDFDLSAWISDDIEGEVDVTWSSSLQGILYQGETSASEVHTVPCHAGGTAEDYDCYLSTGTHVMVLAAVDNLGWTSHSFLTVRIVGPTPDDPE